MSSITELASSNAILKSSSSRVFRLASAGYPALDNRASIDSLKVAQVPVRYVIAGKPGTLISACGVCTLVPEQQPQRQSDVPVQLICSSLSSLHVQCQLAVVGQAWIVVETRDLEWA